MLLNTSRYHYIIALVLLKRNEVFLSLCMATKIFPCRQAGRAIARYDKDKVKLDISLLRQAGLSLDMTKARVS
jgi:hypothetical protein